jgi:hypothetical protein
MIFTATGELVSATATGKAEAARRTVAVRMPGREGESPKFVTRERYPRRYGAIHTPARSCGKCPSLRASSFDPDRPQA